MIFRFKVLSSQNYLDSINVSIKPEIKFQLTTTDKIVKIIAWGALIAIWMVTLVNYFDLPNKIPTYFDIAGKAYGFCGRASVLIWPLIITILFIGLSIFGRLPRTFKYNREITKDNALPLYLGITRIACYLKLAIIMIFGLIEFNVIRYANGWIGKPYAFAPLALALVFISLFLYILRLSKANRTNRQ